MIELETKASGAFSIQLRNSKEEITFETGIQNNLICNGFFTAADSIYAYLAVGTGTTTPAVTDTLLGNQLSSRLSSSGAGFTTESKTVSAGVMTIVTKYTYTFTLGQIVGNIAELGLFSGATGANALTRALIKDTEGNNTVIPVTANDQLVVTYYLTYTQNVTQTPYVVSMMINGVATDVTVSPYFVNVDGWGYFNPLRIIGYNTSIGVGNNAANINATTGVCTGSVLYVSPASSTAILPLAGSSAANGRIFKKSMNFGLTVANGTFNEIYLQTAASNLAYALIVLKLSVPITKLDTESMDVDIHHILKAA